MRTMMIASAGLALMAASGADAGQTTTMTAGATGGGRMGSMTHGGGMMQGGAMMNRVPGSWHGTPGTPTVRMGGSRWGSKVGGHWWGGVNAPGGWNAYRRPARGYALPRYWVNPRFYISDWSGYGLTQPSQGYNWVRYYDDAVLVDSRGSVSDVYDGIDWDRYDNGYDTDDSRVYTGPDERGGYAQNGYAQNGYAQNGYAQNGYVQNGYYADRNAAGGGYVPVAPNYDNRAAHGQADRDRRSDGIAGAVVGGVVGGVAGNLIAGRGNRLGGTLIGAGVGAAAGYAIDHGSSNRGRRDGPGAGYGVPYASNGGYADGSYTGRDYTDRTYPAGGYPVRGQGPIVTSNGGTTVTTTGTGGYAAGGYYFPAGSTTTVVVQQAPVVTTTTTEIYEDRVNYSRPHARTKIVKRWRRPVKCACR